MARATPASACFPLPRVGVLGAGPRAWLLCAPWAIITRFPVLCAGSTLLTSEPSPRATQSNFYQTFRIRTGCKHVCSLHPLSAAVLNLTLLRMHSVHSLQNSSAFEHSISITKLSSVDLVLLLCRSVTLSNVTLNRAVFSGFFILCITFRV